MAQIAGNLLSGKSLLVQRGMLVETVKLARELVAEVKRTEPKVEETT